jgi:phosphoribosylformylglycinamidine cyclo-ligase
VSYEQAGVSLHKAEAIVERLRAAAASTGGDVGGFAGLYPLDEATFLVATTDGVGTKLMLSRRAGRLFDAGRDLAAHCIDDVLTTGAKPLFFLDYVASGALDLEAVVELVEGAAAVCREAGCMILGGESAELPGIYREGELDFAGTCVGIVPRAQLIDGSRCEPGDVVLGLPSSGLHTNGFSLVRQLIGGDEFDADLLLAPHRLYTRDVAELRGRADVKALAHVTGGGIIGNLSRVLPDGVGIEIDWDAWERPAVYEWLADRGVPEEEQRRVFNLGVGMCAVVPERDASAGAVIGRLV